MALVVGALFVYAIVGWLRVLTDEERRAWLALLSRTRNQPR